MPVAPDILDAAGVALQRIVRKPLERLAEHPNRGPGESRKKQQYGFWTAELERANRKLERDARLDEWEKFRRYQTYLDLPEGQEWNFVNSPIRDLADDVTGERPEITVEVRRTNEEFLVSQLEALALDMRDHPELWPTMRRIVSDALWLGIGWSRREWDDGDLPGMPGGESFQQGTANEQAEQTRIAGEELVMKLFLQPMAVLPTDIHWLHVERHRMAESRGATLEARNALGDHIREHETFTAVSDRAQPRIRQVRPEDMLYDPEALAWDRVGWVAEHTVEFLDPDYRNTSALEGVTETLDAEPDDKEGDTVLPPDDPERDPGIRVVKIWRILDLRGGEGGVWGDKDYTGPRLIVLADDHPGGVPLAVLPAPYRGNIYQPLVVVPVRRQIEGVPLPRMIERAQAAQDFTYRARQTAVEQAPKQKMVADKSLFASEAEWRAFQTPGVNVRATQFDKSKLSVIDPPQINPAIYEFADSVSEFINRALRSAEVSQGVSGGAKFATEIQALEAARGRGVKSFREAAADFVSTAVRGMFWDYHDFGTTEILTRASGGVGLARNALNPWEIPLDLIVRVDVDSLSSVNRDLQKKQIIELLELLNGAPQFMTLMSFDGQVQLFTRALRLFGFKDPESMLRPADEATTPMMANQANSEGGSAVPGSPGAPAPAPGMTPGAPGQGPFPQGPQMQPPGAMAAQARAL